MPFLFVGNPALLLRDASVFEIIKSMLYATIAAVVAVQATNNHYFFIGKPQINKALNTVMRIVLIAGCVSFGLPTVTSDIIGLVVFAVILIPLYLYHLKGKGKSSKLNA